MELPPDAPKPRLCHIIKWPDFDGYGFNLHAEKTKNGQYIGKVDEGSPALHAGLREGDKIVEVNGVNISNENHRQVVERIKAIPNETKLLVVDDAAEKWYKEKKITVKASQPNVLFIKTPVPRPESTTPTSIEDNTSVSSQKVNGDALIINNNNNNNNNNEMKQPKIIENGTKEETRDSQKDKSGHSSQNSTPKSVPKSSRHPSESSEVGPVETSASNRPPSSAGSSVNAGSVPASPVSTKSSAASNSGTTTDLNLNMSASEMRQLLAQRKKNDPKKIQMDLRQKYEIIQQM